MTWAAMIALTYILGSLGFVFLLRRRATFARAQSGRAINEYKAKLRIKEELLSEFGEMLLAVATPAELDRLNQELAQGEEQLITVQGRISIAEAEYNAVAKRLNELCSIESELENSSQVAKQELEMLRSQERTVSERNTQIKAELEAAVQRIDELSAILSGSQETVEKLNSAKSELGQAEQQLEALSASLAQVNERYMALKKSYDALDVDYAQLYEKQSGL